MIEHRVSAIASGKYTLEVLPPKGKGPPLVTATFKAVRKQVNETVQLLSHAELQEFVGVLASRGSSRRGGMANHLLTPAAMAARSTTVLWSMVHEFGGDIAGGVRSLSDSSA